MFPPPHKTTRSLQTVPTDLACRTVIRDAQLAGEINYSRVIAIIT